MFHRKVKSAISKISSNKKEIVIDPGKSDEYTFVFHTSDKPLKDNEPKIVSHASDIEDEENKESE